MEPRIIKGHLYKCIKSAGKFYTKGKVYECEKETGYPEEGCWSAPHMCGVITDNQGDKGHSWPYDPEHNSLCNDRWTDYFKDMGEKPEN